MGRGPSVSDVMTGGSKRFKRRITDGVVPGEHYPNHTGIDFFHTYKNEKKSFGWYKKVVASNGEDLGQ